MVTISCAIALTLMSHVGSDSFLDTDPIDGRLPLHQVPKCAPRDRDFVAAWLLNSASSSSASSQLPGRHAWLQIVLPVYLLDEDPKG